MAQLIAGLCCLRCNAFLLLVDISFKQLVITRVIAELVVNVCVVSCGTWDGEVVLSSRIRSVVVTSNLFN